MSERIRQIVPAAAGWRAILVHLGVEGDLAELPASDLYYLTEIACFAWVDDDDGAEYVKPIGPDDWPAYLWFLGDNGDLLDMLGPGSDPTDAHRVEAIDLIDRYRKRRASSDNASAPVTASTTAAVAASEVLPLEAPGV